MRGHADRHATPRSARFFLERGLDVLVEKPIAAGSGEADALVALARARGRVLAVGHVERYNPAVDAVLRERRATPLHRGPPARRAHRAQPRRRRRARPDDPRPPDRARTRRPPGPRGAGGGNAGADGPGRHRQRPDRVRGRLRRQPDRLPRLDRADAQAPRLRSAALLLDRHARALGHGAPPRAATGRAPASSPSRSPVEAGDPLGRELADFAGAVRERRDPLVTGEVGRDALVLAERVVAAIERAPPRRGVGVVSGARTGRARRRQRRLRPRRRSRTCARSGSRRRSAPRRTPTSRARLGGVPVAFLSRHGRGHRIVAVRDQLPGQRLRLQDARLRRAALGLGLREPAGGARAAPRRRPGPVHRPDAAPRRHVLRRRRRRARGSGGPRLPGARARRSRRARARRGLTVHRGRDVRLHGRARSSRRAPSRTSTGPGARTSSA